MPLLSSKEYFDLDGFVDSLTREDFDRNGLFLDERNSPFVLDRELGRRGER